MKYKVGDKVRVKSKLVIGKKYDGILFSEAMASYRGKEYTIMAVDTLFNKLTYRINHPGVRYYHWSESMLEGTPAVTESDLLDFALKKMSVTLEELEKEYRKELEKGDN